VVARAVLLGMLPLVLAGGLWRLERDRPLWRGPREAAVRPNPTSFLLSSSRLILAVHYPWYGTPDGPTGRWRHWNHPRLGMPEERILGFHDPRQEITPGRLDIGATHYPEGGPYDSRDPVRIRAQLAMAREAGLDGLLVSWWGRESEEALSLDALFRHAHGSGVLLAPYYETGELWRRGAAGVAADLASLLDRHGQEPAWLRVDGVPVVFLYASHRLRPVAWDAVRARLAAQGRTVFLVGDAPSPDWLTARPGWLQRFDALHTYTPVTFLARGRDLKEVYRSFAALANQAGRPFIPAVAPGFDDRQVRAPGTIVDRADGMTYDQSWQAALSVDPAWILVSSWNEWHEGSEIEPSREHANRYLDATRVWADRFHRALPPPAALAAPGPGR
jgi:glycoprotein endo-alpha-1,2-mannosidase